MVGIAFNRVVKFNDKAAFAKAAQIVSSNNRSSEVQITRQVSQISKNIKSSKYKIVPEKGYK